MSDFVDADQDLDEPADEWPLRDLILAQGLLGTAIPVLLFTSTQLAAATSPPAGHHHLSVDADADGVGAALVARTATDVGLVPDRVALFSDDAYLLQTALGERLLPSPE